jgi:hypothetical protein
MASRLKEIPASRNTPKFLLRQRSFYHSVTKLKAELDSSDQLGTGLQSFGPG